jgi:hypothetical protein
MTDPQELRGQSDVTGKAKANFRGKIRKNVAYAIRFLGGWHAQREDPGSGAERSLRLLRRAAMLGASLLFSRCADNITVRHQNMIDCNKSLNINGYMQQLSYKAKFVSLHHVRSDC